MADRPERPRDAVDEIFGEALRPKFIDDRENSFADETDHDKWLRENTPPHHQ
ncbi:hypothetical protein MGALJ_33800 [Mycobacterium gallinarum]|uniref:Uncharacterized protein n=1 Tax=Mycobacterium gallinarum TaxID=39689 RepID=A0A9W4B473_9MYCO|nr:hypothetical protein [Mycobacterium gallinarum]BBY93711.1 hypothetical protein MGALJ_33800 [Mycobacterium gallinarum]